MRLGKGRPPLSGWGNPDRLRCPKCRSIKLIRGGSVKGVRRYRCRNCGYSTTRPRGVPKTC